ncbi:MAG: DMT family transporter [Ruminococcaceae bacterium]|nr:DMT family transporter [Oscillospiraceae bacterium]
MTKKLKGTLTLLLATAIWGSTFVAQSVGVDVIGPYTFLAIRCILAVIVLLPVVWFRNKTSFTSVIADKQLWKVGIICGIALFAATALQQLGLMHTTAGKSGFITAMYIILVPIFGLILKKKPPKSILISIVLAAAGLYFLSGSGFASVNIGDLLTLGCAAAFAVQILLLDRFAGDLDCVALNMVQSLVCAVISLVITLFTETVVISDILNCWLPLAYAGVLSMGVAYTLQIVGQRMLDPATASVMMSFESVFAVLSGWLVLNEQLTLTEGIGCALVFIAILLPQFPFHKLKKAP